MVACKPKHREPSPLKHSSNFSKSCTGVMDDDNVSLEILARLPFKSLFRFSCVSKSWRRLISEEDYLRRRLPLVTSAVFYHSDAGSSREPRFACTAAAAAASDASYLRDYSLDFFPFHSSSTIVDCCCGLLLCHAAATATFYVLSPITKKWAPLPPARRRTHLVILAFDPYHSKEYKVLSFVGWLPEGAQLELFSSATGEWAERRVQWGVSSDAMTATLRYFAGTLYILAYPNYIVAVDLDGGGGGGGGGSMIRSRLVPLPETAKPEGSIDNSGGFLHYTCNDGGQIRVWKLEEEADAINGGSKWELRHRVEVRAIARGLPAKLQQKLHLLALHPERDVVYLRLPAGKVAAYDLRKEEVAVACELRKGEEEAAAAYLVQLCVFPFSRHVSHCLTNSKGTEN